jgi:hypothetical protein
MLRRFLNWLTRPAGRPRTRRRRTRLGCLLWILVLIAVLVLLSLFGSFQKGTKAGGAIRAQGHPSGLTFSGHTGESHASGLPRQSRFIPVPGAGMGPAIS